MRAAYAALKPSECWDWIDARDLHRIAIQSLKRAKAECYPPKGERFLDGISTWSTPAAFAETLTRLLVLHVQAEAHAKGIPDNEYAPEQLRRWYEGDSATGAGRSPADMGQGGPASASADRIGQPVDQVQTPLPLQTLSPATETHS